MDARYLEERAMRIPKNPFHPGEMLLEEFLVPGKMTQAAPGFLSFFPGRRKMHLVFSQDTSERSLR